jgi:hypothetical protein
MRPAALDSRHCLSPRTNWRDVAGAPWRAARPGVGLLGIAGASGRPLVHLIRRQLAQLPDTKARNYVVNREAGQLREMPRIRAMPSSANVRHSRFVAWGATTQLATRRSDAQSGWLGGPCREGQPKLPSCERFVIAQPLRCRTRHRASCVRLPSGQPRERPAHEGPRPAISRGRTDCSGRAMPDRS